jgi:peptidoglycan lytic transglycosylase G
VPDYSTVQVDKKYASYQTYQQAGLPATPIASPTLKSIEAALNPVTKSKLLYFYSCPGSTKHSFAKTFKQHQRHIDQCQ